MKRNLLSNTFAGIADFLYLSFALLALATTSHSAEANPTNAAAICRQPKPGDRLDGKPRPICYSGFWNGWHPDRGEGTVNPSDKEVLEVLQLLI